MTSPQVEPAELPAEGDAPAGFHLVVPQGWLAVPLAEGEAEAVFDAYLDHQFRDWPRDRATPFRREVERHLAQLLGDARAVGGLELHVLVQPLGGAALSASLLVSLVAPTGTAATAADLAEELTLPGDDVSVVEVAGSEAVRRVRVQAPTREQREAAVPVLDERTSLDVVLPVPGSTAWLSLAWSTTAPGELRPDLLDLFDAVASTFRWSAP